MSLLNFFRDISLWLDAFEGCVRLGESILGIAIDTKEVQAYYKFNEVIKSYCNAGKKMDSFYKV